MSRAPTPRRNGEAGQALLIVGLVLVVLMIAAGLSIDMGYLRYERRLAQTAADSAAIAGATCNGSPGCQSNVAAYGEEDASYNGFTAGPQTTVTVGTPTSGPHSGDSTYVEAVVTQNVPTFFMKILGSAFSSFPVSARAVAYPGPGKACIYALGSLTLGGSGGAVGGFNPGLETGQCAVYVSGDLAINSNAPFGTSGTVYGGTYSTQSGNAIPAPINGAPAGNPLAYLPTFPPAAADPPPATCGTSPAGVPYTYCAGSYDTGLSIAVPVNLSFSLQPGIYVIKGMNGLSISGAGAVTGTGVTFFVTGGSVSINIGTNYGGAACSSSPPNIGSTVQLSAPTDTSQPFPGILIIQSGNQSGDITLNNGDDCNGNPGTAANASYLWGVLYFPNSQLSLTGTGLDPDNQCSNVPRFTSVIASDLQIHDQVNFGVSDCGGTVTPFTFNPALPDPVKDAVLVE